MSLRGVEITARCSALGCLIGFVGSLSIYCSDGAGRAGLARCAVDLVRYHFVNAWVSLGGLVFGLSMSVLLRLLSAQYWCSTQVRWLAPVEAITKVGVVAGGIFGTIWATVGGIRLWSATPCDTLPVTLTAAMVNQTSSIQSSRALSVDHGADARVTILCCDKGLYYATQGWIVFSYVSIGLIFFCSATIGCAGPGLSQLAGHSAKFNEFSPLNGWGLASGA